MLEKIQVSLNSTAFNHQDDITNFKLFCTKFKINP